MKFILARKVNMTQLYTEDGKAVPVTVLAVASNKVSRIKSLEKDGYEAVQVQMGKKKREFRIRNQELGITEGQEIGVSQFEPGEQINITGVSKGRGFAGAMKRHGFHGAPASHGHDHPRAVGSIGQRFPQHVRPGLRMAGHMGAAKATVKHSMVIAVESEKNLLFVKGGVPGA
ncbi:MAG: 50S ribosomal protein L3, partial [bacterium]|nr:50S ribosomal protein L3 [bacterium]